jgi:hypothetical protein
MEKKEFKERINYIVDESGVLVASPVNYPSICFQAKNIKEMEEIAKTMCHIVNTYNEEQLQKDEPFEFVEMNKLEWEGKDDNITFWEIIRFKRLMSTREDFRTEAIEWLKEQKLI